MFRPAGNKIYYQAWLVALVIFAMSASLFASQVVRSQSPEETQAYGQQLIDAGNNTIAFLLQRFRPHFPHDKKYLLSTQKIGVSVHADFGAFVKYETNEIFISAGLVIETFYHAQALIYLKNRPSARQYYQPWIIYMTKRSRDSMNRFKRNPASVDNDQILTFWAHARLPPPRPLNAQDEGLQQQMMIDNLGLVLAHELGHLVLGHKLYNQISPQQAQNQEYAADDFAADLVRRSGLSVIPGLVLTYGRFATTELMFNVFGASDTHPAGHCRVYRLFQLELERMRRSETDRRNFEINSQMSLQQAQTFMEGVRRDCNL